MSFCFRCGAALRERLLAGDDKLRLVCDCCDYVHYDSPRVLVGVHMHCGQKLMWIKRATEPSKGLWTFPAGFLESGESLQAGAARELKEETGIEIEPIRLVPYGIVSLVVMNQIYMVFRYPCDDEIEACTTSEVEDWGWFTEADAPWGDLAFRETAKQARQTYHFLQAGEFPVRVGEILFDSNKSWHYTRSSDQPVQE
jgi:ADP-ribose pyrophosphatase YjhB (NUDIX family)